MNWQFDPVTGLKGLTRSSFCSLRARFSFYPRINPARFYLFFIFSETLDLIHSPWRAFRYALPALISCLAPGLNLSKIFWKRTEKAFLTDYVELRDKIYGRLKVQVRTLSLENWWWIQRCQCYDRRDCVVNTTNCCRQIITAYIFITQETSHRKQTGIEQKRINMWNRYMI